MLPCKVEEFADDITPFSTEQSFFDDKYDPLSKDSTADDGALAPIYHTLAIANAMDSPSSNTNAGNLDFFLGDCIISMSEIDLTTKPVSEWTTEEAVTWVQTVLVEKNIPFEHFHLEKFNKSGSELHSMSLQDFKNLDFNYGEEIYRSFQQLISDYQRSPDTFAQWNSQQTKTELGFSEMLDVPSKMLSFDPDDKFPSICSLDQGYRLPSMESFTQRMHMSSLYPPSVGSESETMSEPPSPASTSESNDIVVKNRSKPKGSHLWEFVRDLLLDKRYNPHLIRWEDRERGVFKFVKSDQVAKMWGQKKNNSNMNYEKMSRAMRFCRKEGWFTAVPKDKRFPKKLCFTFGPKSSGWNL